MSKPNQDTVFYFTMHSDLYGSEEFGPYDTMEDALAGVLRILDHAKEVGVADVERDFYLREVPAKNSVALL